METCAPRYEWGQRVQAAADLFNDGSYPEQPSEALLVQNGEAGQIVQVGHHTDSGTIRAESIEWRSTMKVMIRKNRAGVLSAYVAKKDLEEPIVDTEKPEMWGGIVTLANGWRLELPAMDAATTLPITVEARKLMEDEVPA